MDEVLAAHTIYDCLLDFGKYATNPVLAVIDDKNPFQSGRHYPDPYFTFSGKGLRAYYHCHSHPQQQTDEHGHFHLFVLREEESWTHLAALSMDQDGQPKRWLSTNRWVTDECWASAEYLKRMSLPVIEVDKLTLVERWLYAMLNLHLSELGDLWQQRDQYLINIKKASADADILEDREHYVLAAQEISLMDKMQKVLQL